MEAPVEEWLSESVDADPAPALPPAPVLPPVVVEELPTDPPLPPLPVSPELPDPDRAWQFTLASTARQ